MTITRKEVYNEFVVELLGYRGPDASKMVDEIVRLRTALAAREEELADLRYEVVELRPLAEGANNTINDLMQRTDQLNAMTERALVAESALVEALREVTYWKESFQYLLERRISSRY